VIGSNVSSSLLTPDKVLNAIQVLMQVAFFRESEDTKVEVPLCNIYIPMPLTQYNMVSFGNSEDIIQYGIVEGRKLYPRFKKLADSLNALNSIEDTADRKLPKEGKIRIVSYDVRGLNHTTKEFFVHAMDLYTNHYYNSTDLSRMVRRASGTRYYSKIVYSLQPLDDSTCKAIFDVEENPLTFGKIGLNYNQFSGISAIINLTSRDLLTPNSRSLVTVNIGENFRARAEHLQYLGRISNFALKLSSQFDQFDITTYNHYQEDGLYNENYFKGDAILDYSTSRNVILGAGARYEYTSYSPSISSSLEFQGSNHFFTSYLLFKENTLDRVLFPKKGILIEAEGDFVYSQNPDVTAHVVTRNQDSAFTTSPYTRLLFKMDDYASLGSRSTLLFHVQAGVNFNYKNDIMNEFSIGGMVDQFHNQVTFSGLREGTFYSPAVATFLMGFRYRLFINTYLTARANVLFNNFITTSDFFTNPNFLSGYSLTASYNFALGPVELSGMYSDQSRRVIGYVNIGIPF
jgi:NTE family protein